MLNYKVKFITCDETLHLKNGDFKTYKYETKKKVEESIYDVGKRNFCEKRGGHWRAARPRQIRQFESKLRDRSIVYCEWSQENLVTIVFSSGAIAYLTVKPETLDVIQILFDRYCTGKLSGRTVTGIVMCKSHFLFSHADRMATLISFNKINKNLPCRISDRDPHLQNIELGGASRRAERKVSWCEHDAGVRVLVWTAASTEPAPWSPAIEDLANIHLYYIHGQQVTLMAYHQLENETLSAELGNKSDSIIHVVEQLASHKSGVTVEWLRYDVPSENRVSRLVCREDSIQVALPAPVRVHRRSPCDSRLLTACIDGSLHVIHHRAGLMHSTRPGFIATCVRWMGSVVVAGSEAGRLQCFDRALSILQHEGLDMAAHVRDTRRMQLLSHWDLKGGPIVMVCFNGGPLTLLRITHPRLLTAWLRSGRLANAVALLQALDWEADGSECLWALERVMCYALRSGLRDGTGAVAAQAALGAFLSARAPLLPAAPHAHHRARTFFHHLLRRGRLEKAMSLAVDLADWDLFMDARWAAQRRGLPALADEAAALAAQYEEHESECSDSCSQCSSHSYSESDAESSASSEPSRTKPPPLPRVPIPQNPQNHPQIPTNHTQNPTILLPITQLEPQSTNSIRPNLHQYLERDNTIWNTAVRDDSTLPRNDIKPILSTHMKWQSVDNFFQRDTKQRLMPISEVSRNDVIPRPYEDRLASHFRHLYQTELREDVPNTLYRYQNSYYNHDRLYRYDEATDRLTNRPGEKNKVKFSDTVTIAVVPEPAPSPSVELAASLPLSPPHAYLAAFAPAENADEKPPKIKVVHFGLV